MRVCAASERTDFVFAPPCTTFFFFFCRRSTHHGRETRLTPAERKVIDDACGAALADMMSALKPSVVVGVGNFAGSKCLEVSNSFVSFYPREQQISTQGSDSDDDELGHEFTGERLFSEEAWLGHIHR